MNFPDPVAFSIGTLSIKWYGLAYIFGLVFAWAYGRWCIDAKRLTGVSLSQWDGAMNSAMYGIVVGGRLGYFVFYAPEIFVQDPVEIFKIWHPGMSFHGGLIGVVVALWLHSRTYRVNFFRLLDVGAVVAPIGLFLGRLANFINQEHCGRPTKMPWGIVFPELPDGPRHPSQLYEAGLEGICLFIFLAFLMRSTYARCPGQLGGMFLMGYGSVRTLTEMFRIPDGVYLGITLGQWYCVPCIFIGFILYRRAGIGCKKRD